MKKCNRCRVVFHDEERQRCLYCDTSLLTVNRDDTVGFRDAKDFDPNLMGGIAASSTVQELMRDWQINEFLRTQYMIGSYFKVRTFKFLYSFSRNQFRMGKDYKRVLAQPLNITSFLTIPWVIIDVVDSFFIRLSYNAYCHKCGWKFRQVHATQEHDATECEYNQEFSRIVDDIVSGNITKTEGRIKQDAYKKVLAGKRSAYKDLCARRSGTWWFIDVLCVWFSILIVLVIVVATTLPIVLKFGHFMTSGE